MPDSKPKDASSENICKEMSSHGAKWATVHGSYFSDPSIAAPLVNAIRRAAGVHSPDVIADIGGGTGFLLSEIGAKLMNKRIKLLNVDISKEQIDISKEHMIPSIQCSVNDLKRGMIINEGERLMLVSLFCHALLWTLRPGPFPILATLYCEQR